MYCDHFKLKQRPFRLSPDNDFFYLSQSQQQAMTTLSIALQQGDGFTKVSGEVGTGKTSLCRKLISVLGDDYVVAHINNSYLSPNELKLLLAQELGVALNASLPSYRILLHIQKRLVQLARANKKVLLVIDEAQAMPRDTLEALRLLSNLETSKRKLLHIILVGQPELDQLLARQDMRQLSQRISYQAQLQPMNEEDALMYIDKRLDKAGAAADLFESKAKKRLFKLSAGNPRLMNLLADKALMCSFADKQSRVKVNAVNKAAKDSPTALAKNPVAWGQAWLAAAVVAGVIIIPGGLGLWM